MARAARKRAIFFFVLLDRSGVRIGKMQQHFAVVLAAGELLFAMFCVSASIDLIRQLVG